MVADNNRLPIAVTIMIRSYQKKFLELSMQRNALRFGEFTLKSGRQSPYFFNTGHFNSGDTLARLGQCYAQAIVASEVEFDMLFGPAYKGIPLATATAIALAEHHQRDVPWCFNRKEAKNHGEGGNLVGTPLSGRVLIIDDVITAGTAIGEAMAILHNHQAQAVGVVIALDRQERGEGALSATQEVEQRFDIPVISIVQLDTLEQYLYEQKNHNETVEAIAAYRKQYGVI